jgi:hypothetical protein
MPERWEFLQRKVKEVTRILVHTPQTLQAAELVNLSYVLTLLNQVLLSCSSPPPPPICFLLLA